MNALIAEDDPFTRQALAEILRQEGWNAVPAENGLKAWELFQQGRFDLACLDIMMPGLSGYDLCRRIRQKDSAVAVLFISAKAEEVDKVLGLELGADDFIVKPFGAREVLARIRAVMRRIQTDEHPPEGRFTLGPWTVLPDELRAQKDDLTIALTPREVQILAFLNGQKGKVVHRVALFQHCWGWENAPQSRTLDQHIAVLRKKLEHDPKNPAIIETVQGVGYRVN